MDTSNLNCCSQYVSTEHDFLPARLHLLQLKHCMAECQLSGQAECVPPTVLTDCANPIAHQLQQKNSQGNMQNEANNGNKLLDLYRVLHEPMIKIIIPIS